MTHPTKSPYLFLRTSDLQEVKPVQLYQVRHYLLVQEKPRPLMRRSGSLSGPEGLHPYRVYRTDRTEGKTSRSYSEGRSCHFNPLCDRPMCVDTSTHPGEVFTSPMDYTTRTRHVEWRYPVPRQTQEPRVSSLR